VRERELTESKIKGEYMSVNEKLEVERTRCTELERAVQGGKAEIEALQVRLQRLDEEKTDMEAKDKQAISEARQKSEELERERMEANKKSELLEKELEKEAARLAEMEKKGREDATTEKREKSEMGTQMTPLTSPAKPPAPVLETLALDDEEEGGEGEGKGGEEEEEDYGDDEDFEEVEAPKTPTAFEVYKEEQAKKKAQEPQVEFDIRKVDVISDSDMINSTIVQLRSTLNSQDSEVSRLRSELEAVKTEKSIAIEAAGVAKLEALELAAKLEVGKAVEKIDQEVEQSFEHSAKGMVTTMDSIAGTAFAELRMKEGFLENQVIRTMRYADEPDSELTPPRSPAARHAQPQPARGLGRDPGD
jgi:hypothetical protein